jgi:hypothetical protein
LIEFRSWLETERQLGPGAINNYASAIRGLFKNPIRAGELIRDPTALQKEITDRDACLSSYARAPFRSAIRAFFTFAALKDGRGRPLEIPFPDQRKARGAEAKARRRERYTPLGPILRELEIRKIPFRMIPRTRWRDVRADGEEVQIRDRNASRTYLVPLKVIRDLGRWAADGSTPSEGMPLVPSFPGRMTPMTTGRLKEIARGR